MEDYDEIEENSKKYKMTLLFAQTKELHERYNSDMELSPMPYYLVDKNWLDNYKEKNDYKRIFPNLLKSNKYNNYFATKSELSKSYQINKNDLTSIDVEKIISNYFSYQTEYLEKYQLNVPINIELIFYKFFEDCLNNCHQMGFIKTDIYIGNQTILIVDEESSKNNNSVLYCCSLVPNEPGNYNFNVKVEYILFFRDIDSQTDEINEMVNIGGLKKYFIVRNIDINKKDEQIIKNKKGKIVGKFLKFEAKNDDDMFSNVKNPFNDFGNSNINMNSNNNKESQNLQYDFSGNQMNQISNINNNQNPNPMNNENEYSIYNANNKVTNTEIKSVDKEINEINKNEIKNLQPQIQPQQVPQNEININNINQNEVMSFPSLAQFNQNPPKPINNNPMISQPPQLEHYQNPPKHIDNINNNPMLSQPPQLEHYQNPPKPIDNINNNPMLSQPPQLEHYQNPPKPAY